MHKREPTDCTGFAVMVQLYVDEELAAEERGAVESHLRSCPTCQNQRDELLVLKSHLFVPVAADAPAALKARVEGDIARAQRSGRVRGAGIFSALLLIAAVVGAMGVYFSQQSVAVDASRLQIAAHAWSLHALDVPVDVATPDRRVAERYVRDRVSGGVHIPTLDAAGFALNGARIVDLDHHRGAQLLYTGRLGERLTVVAVPDADRSLEHTVALPAAPAALTVDTTRGPALFAVHQRAFYVATGDISTAEMAAVGRSMTGAATARAQTER